MRVLVCIFSVLGAASVFADGKFFVGITETEPPPGMPYQRALIIWDGCNETLILQPRWQGRREQFFWVVPLPSEPQIWAPDSEEEISIFTLLFWNLAFISRKRITVIHISQIVGFVVWAVLSVLVGIYVWRKSKGRIGVGVVRVLAVVGVVSCVTLFMALITSTYLGVATRAGFTGVEVEAGPYKGVILKGGDYASVLKAKGLKLEPTDEKVLEEYRRRGWVLFFAEVKPGADWRDDRGMVAPLVAYFKSKSPLYPMALTGTAGKPLRLVLYLIAGQPFGNPILGLPNYRAEQTDHFLTSTLKLLQQEKPPKWVGKALNPFSEGKEQLWLCAWRRTLTGKDMAEDFFFAPARRKTVVQDEWVIK